MFFKRHRRLGMLAAGTFAAVIALTSCSSGDSGTTATSGGEVSQEVKDIVAQYTTEPTAIVQTTPLSKKPEKKSVAFIVCADPTCSILGNFMKEAVESLGWSYTGINAPATDFGSAVQQAVDQKVDYIAGTGSDIATFQNAFDSAKAAGIPYFSCYSSDIPEGKANNLFANCADLTAIDAYSRALTSWVIKDSGASANIGVVNLPEFPTLAHAVPDVKKTLDELCKTCTSAPIDISLDVLSSGGTANTIISYLQSNPDVNYLYLAFGDFEPGLRSALNSAGLDHVKIVGVQAQRAQIQSLAKGETSAWIAAPQENNMWTLADQMARVATGQWSVQEERKAAVPSFFIVDSKEKADSLANLKDGWPGPNGFTDQFKKLWGVN